MQEGTMRSDAQELAACTVHATCAMIQELCSQMRDDALLRCSNLESLADVV